MNTRSCFLGLLALAIVGCGGAVDDGKTNGPAPRAAASGGTGGSGGSKGGGVSAGGDPGDPGNDLPQRGGPTCPATRPRTGDACNAEGLNCLFGKNPTGCDSDSASCQGGKWNVFSTPGCPRPQDAGSD